MLCVCWVVDPVGGRGGCCDWGEGGGLSEISGMSLETEFLIRQHLSQERSIVGPRSVSCSVCVCVWGGGGSVTRGGGAAMGVRSRDLWSVPGDRVLPADPP